MNKLLTWYYLYWKALSVMRQIWDKATIQEQQKKCDEEVREYISCKKKCPLIIFVLKRYLKMTDYYFKLLYEFWIKGTREEELSDIVISEIGLYYVSKKHGVRENKHFDQLTNKETVLHVLLKLRYNSLRTDWDR